MEGKIVELEKDISETDKYQRLLRYVYVDGVLVKLRELNGQNPKINTQILC